MLGLVACNTPEKMLCRSWHAQDVDFDETKLYYDRDLKGKIIQQLKDSMEVTFNKDHTYRLKLPDRYEVGTWRFNATKDTLFTNAEHSGAASKINSLNKQFLNVETMDKNDMYMKLIWAATDTKKK